MNPYEILGVKYDADEATIAQVCESLIRQFPPSKFPEEFREITRGYNRIKSKKGRLEYYMFHREERLSSHNLNQT